VRHPQEVSLAVAEIKAPTAQLARSWQTVLTRRSMMSLQLRRASNAPAWETSETPRSGASSSSRSAEPGLPIA
jgi:hypothetical protein